MFLTSLDEVFEAKDELKERAEEDFREVKLELLKQLKPVIQMGNKAGENVKPEKRMFKRVKKADDGDDLADALDKWEGDRQ